ncbi:flagellar hook-basal body complex protein FliE [Castellaniella sp. S9]|uniref:flagellar hook-basal body complex protein FliE n=1 Tax=Castellaniella sp. S9 TaxID=2993652 RepID=UPI0022B2B3A7|nr:flagellar hook-basal body complex protein FliE [Castellaniella sp. S9]
MITAQALANVENMLAQMRAVTRAAQGLPAQSSAGAVSVQGGFAAELARSLDRVSEAQNAANAQARAFQMGEPGIALNDVMIDMQKAGLAFQATVQVRNRLVDAYKEIANMAI